MRSVARDLLQVTPGRKLGGWCSLRDGPAFGRRPCPRPYQTESQNRLFQIPQDVWWLVVVPFMVLEGFLCVVSPRD